MSETNEQPSDDSRIEVQLEALGEEIDAEGIVDESLVDQWEEAVAHMRGLLKYDLPSDRRVALEERIAAAERHITQFRQGRKP